MTDTTDAEQIARLRTAVTRIARQLDRQVSDEGLTRTEMSVLTTLAGRDSMRARELADVEGLNPTMLSRVLGTLTDAGLIRRRTDGDDRRVVHVETTAAGAKLLKRRRRERGALLAQHLEKLSPERAGELFTALDALEELARACAPAAGGTVGASTGRSGGGR